MALVFFNRVGRRVVELLADAEKKSPTSPMTSAYRASSEAAQTHDAPESLEAQLRTVLHEQVSSQGGGVVNFISLAKIRDKLGAAWEKSAKKADEIAQRAIERRITASDMFTRVDNLNYLILFANLTKQQSQFKCALIAEEVAQLLIGADFSNDLLEVKSARIDTNGQVVIETAPRLADLAANLFTADADPHGGEATIGAPATGMRAEVPSGVRLVYRPMWDVRQNTLATYVCVPAVENPGDTIATGDAALPSVDNPEVAFNLDCLVIQRVVADLTTLQAAGRRLLLIAPVHFETLAARSRRDVYLQMCAGIPQASTRFLIFELVGVPDSIPSGRLLDLAVRFRRFARAIILRRPIAQALFQPPAETGMFAVGADLSGQAGREADAIRVMGRFVAAAQKAGLRTYVHGLGSVSLTTSAVGSGFDYIDGDVITSVVEAPRDAYRFEARNIYANPFKRPAAPVVAAQKSS